MNQQIEEFFSFQGAFYVNKLFQRVVLLLLLVPFSLKAAETVNYIAYYKGVFSLFDDISIADVQLYKSAYANDGNGLAIDQLSLYVTSQKHGTVERLYPFRYLFNSYVPQTTGNTIAFEHIKKGKKEKHYIGLIGIGGKDARLYSKPDSEPVLTPSVMLSLMQSPDLTAMEKQHSLSVKSDSLKKLPGAPIDRMTLLQQMRQQIKKGIGEHNYLVTNAAKLMKYRVSIKRKESLKLAGKDFAAVKVKIEAYEYGKPETVDFTDNSEVLINQDKPQQNYMHAPVYAWFTADDEALPLKFVNRHAIGQFVIEYVSRQDKPSQLALHRP